MRTAIRRCSGDNWEPAADGYAWEVRYAGYRWDAETGLYQVRHRYLHPRLGRWVQQDPLGYVGKK